MSENVPSVKLTLNAQAVRSLFDTPEARVELSQAVTAEIVKKSLNVTLTKVQQAELAKLSKGVEDAFKVEVERYVSRVTKGGWFTTSRLEVTSEYTSRIRSEVDEWFTKQAKTVLGSYINSWEQDLERRLPTLLDQALDRALRKHLDNSPLIKEMAEHILREKLDRISI